MSSASEYNGKHKRGDYLINHDKRNTLWIMCCTVKAHWSSAGQVELDTA